MSIYWTPEGVHGVIRGGKTQSSKLDPSFLLPKKRSETMFFLIWLFGLFDASRKLQLEDPFRLAHGGITSKVPRENYGPGHGGPNGVCVGSGDLCPRPADPSRLLGLLPFCFARPRFELVTLVVRFTGLSSDELDRHDSLGRGGLCMHASRCGQPWPVGLVRPPSFAKVSHAVVRCLCLDTRRCRQDHLEV